MKKNITKIISAVLISVFSFDTCCYGLATMPASQNPAVKREISIALCQRNVRWATSSTPDALRLLKANHNASCIRLAGGNYLIAEGLRGDSMRLLRVMRHEDVEAIMQIVFREDRNRYQAIKELILKYFPPDEACDLPVDLYVNHVVASAFEWLILIKEGLILRDDIPRREMDFLNKIEPLIMNNKTSLFTAEFWEPSLRNRKIRDSLNNGTVFYQAAASKTPNPETIRSLAEIMSNILFALDSKFPELNLTDFLQNNAVTREFIGGMKNDFETDQLTLADSFVVNALKTYANRIEDQAACSLFVHLLMNVKKAEIEKVCGEKVTISVEVGGGVTEEDDEDQIDPGSLSDLDDTIELGDLPDVLDGIFRKVCGEFSRPDLIARSEDIRVDFEIFILENSGAMGAAISVFEAIMRFYVSNLDSEEALKRFVSLVKQQEGYISGICNEAFTFDLDIEAKAVPMIHPDRKDNKNEQRLVALLEEPMEWLARSHPNISSALADTQEQGMAIVIDERLTPYFEGMKTDTSRNILYLIILRIGVRVVLRSRGVRGDINTEVLEEFFAANDYGGLSPKERSEIINAYREIAAKNQVYRREVLALELYERTLDRARSMDEAIGMIAPFVIERSSLPRQAYSLSRVKDLLVFFNARERTAQESKTEAAVENKSRAAGAIAGSIVSIDPKIKGKTRELIAEPIRWLAGRNPILAEGLASAQKQGLSFGVDERLDPFFERLKPHPAQVVLYLMLARSAARLSLQSRGVPFGINAALAEEWMVANIYYAMPEEDRGIAKLVYKAIADILPDYDKEVNALDLYLDISKEADADEQKRLQMLAPFVYTRSSFKGQLYNVETVQSMLDLVSRQPTREEKAPKPAVDYYMDKIAEAAVPRVDARITIRMFEEIAAEAAGKSQLDDAIEAVRRISDPRWRDYALSFIVSRMATEKSLLGRAAGLALGMRGVRDKVFALNDVAAAMIRYGEPREDAVRMFQEAIAVANLAEDAQQKAQYIADVQTKMHESGITLFEPDADLKSKTMADFGCPGEMVNFILAGGCAFTRAVAYKPNYERERIAVMLAVTSSSCPQITDQFRQQLFGILLNMIKSSGNMNDREKAQLTGDVLAVAAGRAAFVKAVVERSQKAGDPYDRMIVMPKVAAGLAGNPALLKQAEDLADKAVEIAVSHYSDEMEVRAKFLCEIASSIAKRENLRKKAADIFASAANAAEAIRGGNRTYLMSNSLCEIVKSMIEYKEMRPEAQKIAGSIKDAGERGIALRSIAAKMAGDRDMVPEAIKMLGSVKDKDEKVQGLCAVAAETAKHDGMISQARELFEQARSLAQSMPDRPTLMRIVAGSMAEHEAFLEEAKKAAELITMSGREKARALTDIGEFDEALKCIRSIRGMAEMAYETANVAGSMAEKDGMLGRAITIANSVTYDDAAKNASSDIAKKLTDYVRARIENDPQYIAQLTDGLLRQTGAAERQSTSGVLSNKLSAKIKIHLSKKLYDTEFAVILLTDLANARLQEDNIYEIKYDISRLSASQVDIVEEYIRLLKSRSSDPDNIRSRPFSSSQGSDESLIAVYCTGKDFKGEGHVDISIQEGSIKDYLLRITGMMNIALAASNIPDNLSEENLGKYRSTLSYINNQYKSILGEELAIPDSPQDILKVIRKIMLNLPKAMRSDINQIEEYNRLAKKALIAA